MSSRPSEMLIARMSKWMQLDRGDGESEAAWMERVIYSGIGLNMLAALYDSEEDSDDETVSMQHILSRGIELAQAYGEICHVSPTDHQQWVTEIRRQYIDSGYMLHRSNRLSCPNPTGAHSNGVIFMRGVPPWRMEQISGIGLYRLGNADASPNSIQSMFRLLSVPINVWWRDLLSTCRWRSINEYPNNVEYASIQPRIGDPYWFRRIPREPIALCRTIAIPHLYSLLRNEPGGLHKCDLMSSQVDGGQYRQIVLGMRNAENRSPVVTITRHGVVCTIHPGYQLPRPEKTFLDLYSWPVSDTFKRTIATDLLTAIMPVFTNLGYIVQEDPQYAHERTKDS